MKVKVTITNYSYPDILLADNFFENIRGTKVYGNQLRIDETQLNSVLENDNNFIRLCEAHKSKGSSKRTQHSQRLAHASIMYSGISTIGGRVDTYRTRGHLRNSNDIGKLGSRKPMMLVYGLCLNKRQHAISSTEAEDTNYKKCIEKL